MRKALLAAVAASLLTGTVIALGQSFPGVNSPYNLVWNMVWEASTLKPTYSSGARVTSTANPAQDVCGLNGSATKTLRVRRVIISGSAAAVESIPVALVKFSTLYTINGATPGTEATIVPLDSVSSAATGTVETWAVNPTVGTLVGTIADVVVTFPNATTGIGTGSYAFTFGNVGGSALVLHGTAQNVTINLGSTNFNTGVLSCTFEWTEE